MFGSWKKILEYLELVFDLLTQSKAELEQLKLITDELGWLTVLFHKVEIDVEQIKKKLYEKEG